MRQESAPNEDFVIQKSGLVHNAFGKFVVNILVSKSPVDTTVLVRTE